MKRQNIQKASIGILAMVTLLILAGVSLARNSEVSRIRQDLGQFREKVSPVLLDEVAFTKANPAYDREIPVIVKVKKQYFEEDLDNRRQLGRSQRNMLKGIRSYTGRLNSRQIEALLASDQVEYVTLDPVIRATARPVQKTRSADGPTADDATAESPSTPEEPTEPNPYAGEGLSVQDLMASIGADQIQVKGKTPSGKNIGIAVFDSGISHADLVWDGSGEYVSVNFLADPPVLNIESRDRFGHGTAVAGVIGGDGAASDGDHTGIAPGARFIDVKVVRQDGTGRTSKLIRAIDWVIGHKDEYGIRIANLSLGHPPVESYENDPLCQAVERMVKAGIVTIVSAGNLGRTAEYPEIWAGISSPGNDPLVITVGAVNTKGTATLTDDVAASYSSRGPTYLDGLFKPDLVAPGNAIICPKAKESYLAVNYPELHVDQRYIRLSGSSIATAVVSGTAALMLDANPNLNPNLVKLILLTTAIKMDEPSMLEQGNGMVNAKTAVELAKAVNMTTQTVANGVSPNWTLNGEYGLEEVWAGGAFAYGDQIVYGEMVQADIAGFWGEGVFWTDFLFKQEGVFWADSIFQYNGVFWTDSIFWGNSLAWTEGVFWTDVSFSFDGVFWTDFFGTRGVFWTDALIVSDGTETDIAAISGD